MKTKIYKICGVALALVLVFSLAGAFLPINQAEAQGTTPNMWQGVDIPTPATEKLRVADAVDIAVAGDGRTIYVVDNNIDGAGTGTAVPGAILKSDTNGMRFSLLPNPLAGQSPRLIAVSPDDPNAVAMVDDTAPAGTNAGGLVWISNNGGTTWAFLNAVPSPGTGAVVTDIAVGPARAGTILQRDYVVSVAHPTAGSVVDGDILFMGLTTNWVSVAYGANQAFGDADDTFGNGITYDFTSVAISPGFLGDRCVAAVGSDTTGLAPVGDTNLIIIETLDVAPLARLIAPPGVIALNTATTNSPGDFDGPAGGVANNQIAASSVAFPADFDPTTPGGTRTFVGYTSGGLAAVDFDDAYRVDFQTVRKLETGTANGIFSIAYSGTIAGGVLIAGENVLTAPTQTTLVHHTEDPNVSQPSWQTSAKSPTGAVNCVVGIDAADPTLVYAGTTGVESAFSWSTNGAVSFNQRSLINTSIDILQDVMVSPDGSTVFLATSDDGATNTTGTTSGSDLESLWMSSVPTTADSWERVRISPADWGDLIGDSIIRLSPEWDTVPALYWADGPGPLVAGLYTGTPGTGLQRSADGGGVFATRTAPGNIADLTVENDNILYMSDAVAVTNVYKSTNGAWFFGLPVDSGFPIYDIEMAPTYPEKPVAGNVIAGTMIGNIIYSPSAADFFIPLLPLIAGGGNIQVVADVDYANNNTLYAADSTAGSGIWRWQIGTSTTWENIGSPAGRVTAMPATAVMTGLGMHSGVLYSSWLDPLVAPAIAVADAFTITYGGAVPNAGTITVLAGSVQATCTVAAGAVTLGGVASPFSFPILPGAGAVAFTIAAATQAITFTATTANSTGTWTQGAGPPVAAIIANLDGDEAVAAAGGNWVLTDTVGVAGVAAASGAERSLVPTVPVIANWTFETMDAGSAAANFNSPPNALRVAGTATEVSLWAIDTTGRLMAYDDTMALAKPELTVPETVAFDPVQGRNTQFTISWAAMSNATNFRLEIYSDPACTQRVWRPAEPPAWYEPPSPLSPAVVVPANTLVAGTDYFVRLKATDQMPLDAISSPWSSVYRFSVAGGERVEVSYLGPQPLGPTAGSIDVPLSPGFTWSPYASATRYEFQLATDAGFAAIVAETKTSATGYKYDGKLSNAATYFWRVRGIEPTVTDWSPVASFTTEKAPPPPPPTPPPPPPPPPPVVTPAIIWAIIGIGAVLVIAVIVLIVRAGQKT